MSSQPTPDLGSIKSPKWAYQPTGHVGLLDSGLGGLSVVKALQALAPHFTLDYFADSLYCPYGLREPEFIRQRILKISQFLLDQGVEIVVVACNTASAAGLEWLRSELDLPIVGMEPAVKPAVMATRNGRIGVLATGVTLEAQRFANLVERFAGDVEVFTEAAPELVGLVEAGSFKGPVVEKAVEKKIQPLLRAGVDTLVLGCTHFPFLAHIIDSLTGPHVKLIETGPSVAAQTVRIHKELFEEKKEATIRYLPEIRLWTSAHPETTLSHAKKLLPDLTICLGESSQQLL